VILLPLRFIDLADLAITGYTGELAVEGHQPAARTVAVRGLSDSLVESVACFEELPAGGFELGNHVRANLSFQAKLLRLTPQPPGGFREAKFLETVPDAIKSAFSDRGGEAAIKTAAGHPVAPLTLFNGIVE
jgi:hypothetical protein